MSANLHPAKWSADDLLKAVEQLPPREAEQLYGRLREMRSSRRGVGLPAEEAALLAKVNRGFSDAWWARYHLLLNRRNQETLTTEQHRELLRLTDQFEQREAKRLQALVQLADLRQQPLRSLMKDLGLSAKTHA